MKKRITIKDVAAAANVSRQTVSRAINNQGDISPVTKARVLEAIEDLGYQPNRLAQGMVTQRTKTVALLVGDIANPFFPEVARGVQDCARTQGYNVFLCNTDYSATEEAEMMQRLAAQGVDGIITFASHMHDEDLLRFADNYRPLVVINRFIEHPHINLLLVDNKKGARLAVEYFISTAHSQMAMITNENGVLGQTRRVQGFQECLVAHNLPHEIIVQNQPTIAGGFAATKTVLESYQGVTAVFAYNDLMAIGSIQACQEVGLRVPEDVSIIGFDDIQLASVVTPKLSSVHVDKYAIGHMTMARLFAMLQHPENSFDNIYIDPTLILRESTKRDSSSE